MNAFWSMLRLEWRRQTREASHWTRVMPVCLAAIGAVVGVWFAWKSRAVWAPIALGGAIEALRLYALLAASALATIQLNQRQETRIDEFLLLTPSGNRLPALADAIAAAMYVIVGVVGALPLLLILMVAAKADWWLLPATILHALLAALLGVMLEAAADRIRLRLIGPRYRALNITGIILLLALPFLLLNAPVPAIGSHDRWIAAIATPGLYLTRIPDPVIMGVSLVWPALLALGCIGSLLWVSPPLGLTPESGPDAEAPPMPASDTADDARVFWLHRYHDLPLFRRGEESGQLPLAVATLCGLPIALLAVGEFGDGGHYPLTVWMVSLYTLTLGWAFALGLGGMSVIGQAAGAGREQLLALTDLEPADIVRGKCRAVLESCKWLALPSLLHAATFLFVLITKRIESPTFIGIRSGYLLAVGTGLYLAALAVYAYAVPRYAMWVSLYVRPTVGRVGLILLAVLGSNLCFTGGGIALLFVVGHVARMEMNRSLRDRLAALASD